MKKPRFISIPSFLRLRVLKSRRVLTSLAALLVLTIAASAFVLVRSRAAGNGFQWPVALTRIFGGRTAVLNPLPEPFVAPTTILAWDTNGIVGAAATYNSTTTDANLSTSILTRGSGLVAASLASAFNSNDFTSGGTFANAVTNNDYVQFTVSPTGGFKVSLGTLDANFRRTSTGPNAFQWQYSLDGFATAGVNIGSAISYTLTTANGDAQTQISLSGISALQNVVSGTTITFRLYGYGATGSSGAFAIGLLAGNDLAIGGTTTALIPAGTYTVGSGGTYATLTAAIADYNARGVAGPVVFSLTDATYSGETYPITIGAASGSSATNTLTIKPATGVSPTLSGNTANGLIRLSGASNVVIDGSNAVSGTTRNLTITNTNTGGAAITFIVSANSNTVKNSVLKGNGTGGGVINFYAPTSPSTISNNTIQNCTITTAGGTSSIYGIVLSGTSSTTQNNNLITGNTLTQLYYGVYSTAYYTGTTISNNSFFDTSNTSDNGKIGIWIGSSTGTTNITGNHIFDVKSTFPSSSLQAIILNQFTGDTVNVTNNVINLAPAADQFPEGIASVGDAGIVNVYFNSVLITGTAATNSSIAFDKAGNHTCNIANNVFSNTRSTGAGQHSWGMWWGVGPANITSNYNDVVATGTNGVFGRNLTTDISTLSAWQTATSRDANSISLDPQFVSAADLHITRTSPSVLSPVENAGITIAGITTDLDGDTRSNPPDIGADEVTTMQFSSATYSVAENVGGGIATITVSRTAGSGNAGTVHYATSNNTAAGGASCGGSVDYVNTSGDLSFAAGDTSKTFDVPICNESTFESDETVNLTLTAATGSILGTPDTAVLTITNDDANDVTFSSSGNLAAGTYNNVTINSPAVVSLTGNVIITGTLIIDTGGTLDCGGFILSGAGTFTLNAGGTLAIGDPNGITSGACGTGASCGNIRTTTRTFDPAANYIYNGNANQSVGNGLPGTVANLTLANSGSSPNNVVSGNSGQIVTGLLHVQSGDYSSASDYVDVLINNGAELALTADITVSGNWTNNGTFTHNNFTVTFDGSGAQTITTGGITAGKTFAAVVVNKGGGTATLAGDLSDTTLTITAGGFDQGVSFNVSTGTVNVGAAGTWTNIGSGDLALSGNVSNSGTMTFNGGTTACGEADDIAITSTAGQRTWTGAGTFSVTDVTVSNQGTTPPPLITVHNGTDGGSNGLNWVFLASCTGNAYTWTGGSIATPTDWTVAANWSPARVAPDPSGGDVLSFTSTTPSPTVTNVAGATAGINETISALHIANGVTPTFSTGGANTLTINPGAGNTGFDVYALAITGSNPLTIKLAAGTLGAVSNTVSVAGGAHQLIGQSSGAVTFQNSSFFTTSTGFTGHPFGDGSSAANGAAGSIVFALGSTYSHGAGSSPFGASGNASVVTFQTGSFARYFTATGFDASGRTYADLQIGDASIAVNASQSGAGSFQFDNLAVNSTGSANSSLTYNGSNTSAITIQGNITSVGLGDGGTLPDIILTAGSGGIVINKPGGGTLTFGNISNSGRSIDLESNTILDSGTTLNLGRIVQMGFIATRTLTANGTLVPNFLSAPGYVIGNLKKSFSVAGSKTFEVGVNGYSPVAVNATAGTFPADFTAKANTPKLPAMSGTNSLARYWALTATGITADLTFNYLAGDVTGLESNYKIVKSDGTLTAYNPSSPIDTVNHIATLNGVSSFSNWTLGQTTTVSSLNRTTSSPSNATDVTWLITFADGTDGLTAGNFELVNTGLGGSPAITGVSQTGAATWNITASTGTGDGTLGLNMVNGTGLNRTVTNLPFTGQVYAIDRTAPSTTSFTRQTPATSPTGDDTLVFRATFSEDVINVDATDFAVTGTTATITTVTPVSGSIYDLTVSGGDLAGLNGTVGLNFGGSLNITDAAGNALPNTEPGTDQTYTVENSAPDLSITKSGPATATEGNSFTYTLTVLNSNSATGAATGVSVTDVLPAGVTFVSASAGCTGTSTVTCAGADIPVGGSDTFTIVVNAGAPASVSNSADASATNDPASPHTSNTVATTINAAVCTAPPSGMVSWYPGENNANDIYGPNNGALINGTAFAPGKVGQAFSLDGNDDRVEVSPPGTLNITGNKLTMDGWINPVANTSSFYFGRSAPSDHPYLVFFSSGSNSIHIVTRTNPGSQVESDTLYAPPTNRWTHIAMVYDGATMKLYADGVEVFSAAQTGNLDSSSLPFIIGNRPAEAPGTSFNGLIDEVEVFNQALSPAQVAAIYNAGSAGKCHDSTLQFSSATYSEVENVGGGNATITVTRTGAHDTAVSVDYATIAGGSATSGGSCSGTTDYLTTSGPLSFAINETSKTFDIPICNDNFFEAAETVNLELSNAGGPGAALGSPSTAVLTINSDDPQPTISIADASQNELNTGASNFVFNVTLSNPSSTDVVIDYSTADGTINPANAGSDYTAITTGILTIPANSTSGTINVSVNGDNTVEPDETFFVNLTGVTGASMPDTQALGTIINDDTDVSVAVSPPSSAEDTGSNLVYTFTRTGVTTGLLTVNFTVAGTASFPSDYAQTGAASFSSSSGTVTIGAGNPSATVTIDPTTDISYEPSETVILTVTSGAGYNVGSPSAATGTITDDDPIPTTLVVTKTADTDDGFCSLDDCSLREAISNANVISDTNTINFAIPAATDTGCNSLTGVCTIKPSPALPTISTPVNINGYTQTGASANTLAVGSDAALKIELDGTNAGPGAIGLELQATLSSVRGLVINRFGLDGIRLTLNTNNVVAGNFIGTDVTGTSAAGNGAHGIHLSGASTSTIGGMTAADRNVISGGTTSGSQGIQIAGTGTGNVVKGNYIGTNAAGTATLPNAGDGVKIISSSNTIIGGATALEANVIAGNGLDGIRVNGDGTIIKSNFIGTNSTGAVLGNGQAGVLIVLANNNVIGGTAAGEANTIANNGIKGVFVQSGTGNAIRNNSIHSNTGLGIDLGTDGVTANDDGAADDIDTGANNLQNFPVIAAVVVGTPNTISGTLDSTPSQTFTIDFYSNPAGSCDPLGNGEGRTYLGSKSTTTDANGLGGFRFNPATLNANDVVTATATDSAGNTSEFSACKTAVAIAFGQIKFATANAPNTNDTETLSNHVVNIVVQRVGGADRAVSVDYEITDGTATSEDYSAANGTLTWANGDATDRNIPVTVKGDTKFELNETVNIKLVNAQGGATIAGDNPVTLTIVNDDTQPTISINDVPQNEGNGPGTTNLAFTVSLSNASYLPITVDYATALGTTNPATVGTCGTAGVDYQTVSGTVSFAPGESSNNTTVQVPVCGDTTFEANETFFVNLSNANANATILDGQGLGTITNDDPLPTISIDNVTHNEGNFHGVDNNEPDLTNYTFTVSLSNPSDQTITVDYVTANDSAIAPLDYTALTTTTLTFNPGETSKPVTVVVNGDITYELNERFFVNLSNVNAHATILDGQGDGTITNDDAAPTFSINDRSNNEGTMPVPLPSPTPLQFTTQTFTVTKTGSTAVTATVSFATAPGSATENANPCPSGDDYQAQSGSLTFLANETTKTITVQVCKDPDFEANETFFVNLTAPTHATFTDDQGQGTILNDDIPSAGFLVNTTDDLDDTVCDAGHCSLREAITAANGSSTAVAISFNIPADDHFNLAGPRHFYYQDDNAGGGANGTLGNVATTTQPNDSANLDRDPDWPNSWWSILPTSQLPATTKQVFINGDSQAGAAFNTLTTGTNAILRIELNGASAGLNATGLTISGGTSTVRGLVINRFQRDGSAPTPTGNGLSLPSGNNTISGNFIGTDVSGTLDVGSLAGLVTGSGISTTSFNNVIGGATPDVVNLIAGNDRDGISFSNSNTNVIRGNLIGTKANGTSTLGNGASGISFTGLGSVANTVGGPDTGQANTIAFNSGDGVSLSTANFGNSIRGNSIFSNGTTNLHLGIDLGTDGVTPNDNLDTDTGPNNLQNFPIITATMVTGSTRTITGTLNSSAGDTFIIDFYQSPACDTVGGNGEGKTYLGSTDPPVTTDGTTGNVTFTFHPSVLTIGQFVTATATSTGAGFDTSEFSACTQVLDGSSGAGDIVFRAATYTVGEAGVTASITVGRDGGSNGSVTAKFSTVTGGTATAGSDYTTVTDFPITYVEGETGDKTVNVSITNDTTFEGNETVNLSLSHPRVINATEPDDAVALVADPYAAVLTITENDPAPTFTIDDVTHAEGNSGTTSYVFTVTKGGSTALNAGVSFQTQDGTATTADNDYQTSSGTLSFLPADTTKTITVLVNGDTTVELPSPETFFVNLTSPTNATIADSQGLGTITNDDTDVTVAVAPASVAEDGAPNLVYTFTRNGVTSGALTVNFSVGGTATFATDYTQTGAATFTASAGTVTFGAGLTTKTVTVDPSGDTTVEGDETVLLTITTGTGYNVASPSAATGTITNDDTDVTVAVSPASVSEDGVSNLVYTFTRAGVTTGALTVNLSVGGTAVFNTDYAQTGAATFGASIGTVTFGAGNATAAVTIDPTPDISFESNETVILTVTAGTGYNVGSPAAATGTINNDDAAGGIIQFTANAYNTTENSRLVTITVERLGSNSGAVTANYTTPDDSESTTVNPCNTNTSGFASPRCDFTTALGTIRFADGDSAPKTFDVLISQDSYVEPPEVLTVTLSNLTGPAVFGANTIATVSIADDDLSAPVSNPIDDPQNFVRQHYHDFLNREPDAAGLAFWTNEITSCGTNQQCIDFKRVQVSAAFYLSIEFQDTGYLVERLYKAAYGDGTGSSTFGVNPQPHQLPVPIVRFSEFLGDTQEIGQGVVVGAPGWPQALENNKAVFADKFVQRARFVAAFPLSMTPAQFVDKLNLNAGNPLSQAERDQLVADLTSSAKTRAQVLRAVAEDQDLKNSEFNRAFVLMQYFGYLRRNPNVAPDSDYSGFDFWLTKLNQFNGNFQNADMVKAFITSAEYRNRSGP